MKDGLFYFVLLSGCVICAIACNFNNEPEEYPLRSVTQIQQELVDRGHDITVDGKFGKNTDLALTIEITKIKE
jgi:hypothetical protein